MTRDIWSNEMVDSNYKPVKKHGYNSVLITEIDVNEDFKIKRKVVHLSKGVFRGKKIRKKR